MDTSKGYIHALLIEMQYKYFETLLDLNVLYDSFQKCKSSVDWKCSIQRFEANIFQNIKDIKKRLKSGRYKPDKFVEFDVDERGKTRHIKSLSIRDRVLQRAICDYVLEPLIYPKLIYNNGASVKEKGVDFSRKQLDKHLRKHYNKRGNKGYILVGDFSKFFESIPHDKLIESLKKCIPDQKMMDLLEMIIRSFSDTGVGLGIGSQISQICGIYYPTPIDIYCTTVMGCKAYARHMDDFYIIHEDKEFLKTVLTGVRRIASELGLKLNEKKTQICRIDKGFNFLKQRIFITDTGKIVHKPNKSSFVREKRKLKSFKFKYDIGEMTKEEIESQYKSWRNNVIKFDCKKTIHNVDELYSELYEERNVA